VRYDVKIVMTFEHHLAIDADNPDDARSKAFDNMGDRDAEKQDIEVHIEKGVTA
jgi:hypothetical protein